MGEQKDEVQSGWYDEYLRSERWARLSSKCKERDNKTCQFCRKHESQLSVPLNAHHTTYMHLNSEIEQQELDDLITLCKTCHERLHRIIDRPESLYDQYKKIRLALVLPALPAYIKAREAEIRLGANMAHEILRGCPRGYGIPNKVYRMVSDKIGEKRGNYMDEENLYLLRGYLPSLFEGIQKEENIMYKREQRGDVI